MQVDLTGRTARISAPPGALSEALVAGVAANGALPASDSADLLVIAADSAAEAAAAIHAAGLASGGRVVLLTSAAALVPLRGETERNVAAAGVASLARSLAMAFAARNILVNAVAVGATAPGDRRSSHAPTGPASVPDVVNAVLFLLDPAASYLTGHVLAVDGGWSAGYTRDF